MTGVQYNPELTSIVRGVFDVTVNQFESLSRTGWSIRCWEKGKWNPRANVLGEIYVLAATNYTKFKNKGVTGLPMWTKDGTPISIPLRLMNPRPGIPIDYNSRLGKLVMDELDLDNKKYAQEIGLCAGSVSILRRGRKNIQANTLGELYFLCYTNRDILYAKELMELPMWKRRSEEIHVPLQERE